MAEILQGPIGLILLIVGLVLLIAGFLGNANQAKHEEDCLEKTWEKYPHLKPKGK